MHGQDKARATVSGDENGLMGFALIWIKCNTHQYWQDADMRPEIGLPAGFRLAAIDPAVTLPAA